MTRFRFAAALVVLCLAGCRTVPQTTTQYVPMPYAIIMQQPAAPVVAPQPPPAQPQQPPVLLPCPSCWRPETAGYGVRPLGLPEIKP